MTDWSESLKALVLELAANPKTTAVAAASSAGIGTVAALDIIRGATAAMAVGAGVMASLSLARYHRANERNMRLKNLMLEQQLRDAGIDPGKE